jgi:lipopolysaccharide export system protein LptA
MMGLSKKGIALIVLGIFGLLVWSCTPPRTIQAQASKAAQSASAQENTVNPLDALQADSLAALAGAKDSTSEPSKNDSNSQKSKASLSKDSKANGGKSSKTNNPAKSPNKPAKKSTSKQPLSSQPLILDKADLMQAARITGNYELIGNVQMHHDSMILRCQRALWNTNAGILDADGGIEFEHPDAFLTANAGRYERSQALANVWGNAKWRTRNNRMQITGEKMSYYRNTKILEVQERALLIDIPKPKNPKDTVDTLFISGQRMAYDDKTKQARVWGQVRIWQGDMELKCDSLLYSKSDTVLWMYSNAVGRKGTWHIRAHKMQTIGEGRKVRLMSAFGDAQGDVMRDTSRHPDKHVPQNRILGDTLRAFFEAGQLAKVHAVKSAQGQDFRDSLPDEKTALRSVVDGDTLWAYMENRKMREMLAYPQAKGRFWDTIPNAQPSQATGDTLRLKFLNGQADSAFVKGKAQSTYHAFQNGVAQGRNEVQGDSMQIEFHKGRVQILTTEGNLAQGRWYSAPKIKKRPEEDPQGEQQGQPLGQPNGTSSPQGQSPAKTPTPTNGGADASRKP